nr:hypothetical protein CFP56_10770 [Quercus suber]
MVGSGPHQRTPNRPEPAKSRHQGDYGDPGGGQDDNGRFREGSVHTSTASENQAQKRDEVQATQSEEAHSHAS